MSGKVSFMLALVLMCVGVQKTFAVNSGIIFDNGAAEFRPALISELGGQEVAENFVLASGATTITGIHWFGRYGGIDIPDDFFTIRVFEDDDGAPNLDPLAVLFEGDPGRTAIGDRSYEYWVEIDSFDLFSDTVYWLSITNTVSPEGWGWADSTLLDDFATIRTNPPGADEWRTFPGRVAFNLTGPASGGPIPGPVPDSFPGRNAIPEPLTATLGVMGLASLSIVSCRRRNA